MAIADPRQPEPGGTLASNRIALLVVAGALLLRILQTAVAAGSPITFNPGADESYYLQFGEWVAANGLRVPAEFGFMDPAYGYLIGTVFAVAGPNVLALYLLQSIMDAATVWLLYRCGIELGSRRAGLVSAGLYALCATAIMFTTTSLKATTVAFCVAGWTLLALRLLKSPRPVRWFLLGVAGGLIVGVRGNLLLWSLGALAVLPWLVRSPTAGSVARAGATLALGLAVGLSPWSLRNAQSDLGWSPLPFNGGIVLHHTYNATNPRALMEMPEFVNYRHPLEIWLGYKREAERLHGRSMTPREVSSYWQGQAVEYALDHPAQLARNAARKLREFVAAPEIPNNRIFIQERALSPVLSALPAPFPWLFALGLPGLALLLRHDRRGWAVLIPLAACLATALIFFPEDRFRFHGVPTLAIGAGILIDRVLVWWKSGASRAWAIAVMSTAALATLSFWLGHGMHYPTREIEREAWGYLRMGQTERAETLAREALAAGEDNARLHELLGFLASRRSEHGKAVEHFGAAVALRPHAAGTWYSLAVSLRESGDPRTALAAIESALQRESLPDYLLLKAQLLEQLDQPDQAIAVYRHIEHAGHAPAVETAATRLSELCMLGAVHACPPTDDPSPK